MLLLAVARTVLVRAAAREALVLCVCLLCLCAVLVRTVADRYGSIGLVRAHA